MGATHQHAVVAVLVKKHHSRFRWYCNFLFGKPSVVGEEYGLAALTSIACRGEVKK